MKSKISCKQNFYNINTRLALSLSLSLSVHRFLCVAAEKHLHLQLRWIRQNFPQLCLSLSHTHTLHRDGSPFSHRLPLSLYLNSSESIFSFLSFTHISTTLSLSCISFMCPCSHYLKYWYKHALSYSYTHGTTHTQPLSFKWSDIRYLNGIFLASFSLHLTEQMWSIKVAVDCIRSRVLWYGR